MKAKQELPQVIPDPPGPIDWDEAASLYVDEGLSCAEVARRMGRDPHAIGQGLRARGVPRRRRLPVRRRKWGERLYAIWQSVKNRCRRPRLQSYQYYGAKGIDYCSEWEQFESFRGWAIKAGYKPGRSLALKAGATVFSPRTCRWVSAEEKVRRRLRLAPPRAWRLVNAFGETKGVAAWARDPRCRVKFALLYRRLDAGYSPEEAITLPEGATPSPRKRRLRVSVRRPRARPWHKIDGEAAARLHTVEGLPPGKIAQLLGSTISGVRARLKRMGIYRPQKRKRPASRLGRSLYRIWYELRSGSSDRRRSADSGRKGVLVSKEWDRFEPFYAWATQSGYRKGLCLSRVDREAEYSPNNCRWATRAEISRRKRPPNRPRPPRWTISAFGETKGPTAWSKDPRCAVRLPSLIKRLRSGIKPAEAITRPRTRVGNVEPKVLVKAFGMTKNLTDWSRDRRCRVTMVTIAHRLRHRVAPEIAIAAPPYGLDVDVKRRKRARRRGASRR
ncbi:MAG: hypothetical protein HY721_33190 [Planctomycetes bacterium]|nr:hypothetical protein [Planctomycetota bacterium]